ncbi:hypothetical protein V1512DRAFT_259195 [Lipomyces arxii]|uniref:uncharacterized protein n=1 Tax=Lipomyces arxii TaxID=56418 RepID=UPI0034CD879A
MAPFKLRLHKKKTESEGRDARIDDPTEQQQALKSTIIQVQYPDSAADGASYIMNRRESYYSKFNGENVPQGGLISLVPSTIPDDQIQSQKPIPPHIRQRSSVSFNELDSEQITRIRKAEDVAAMHNVNMRIGAERDTAMATYRTDSYESYEQRPVVDESSNLPVSYPVEETLPSGALDVASEGSLENDNDNSSEFSFVQGDSISTGEVAGFDEVSSQNVSPPLLEVLHPLPRHLSNITKMSDAAASGDNLDYQDGTIPKPQVISVGHHPGDDLPSSASTQSVSNLNMRYPAPIPARIKLPPLLSKRKSAMSLNASASTSPTKSTLQNSFTFPMTAPMEQRLLDDGDSASDASMPDTPGLMSKLPNPHQALDELLDNWDKAGSTMEPFTPNTELPIVDGPRSLIHELEERKIQQKARQKNTVYSDKTTLLQMDEVIRRGQDNRRSVFNSNGVLSAPAVKAGEDELLLGVIYNNRYDPSNTRVTSTVPEAGHRPSLTSTRALDTEMMTDHRRRSSGQSVFSRAQTLETSTPSQQEHRRKESWASTRSGGAPFGAIMPEEPRTISRLNLHDPSPPSSGMLNMRMEAKSPNMYSMSGRDMSSSNLDRQSMYQYPSAPVSQPGYYPPLSRPASVYGYHVAPPQQQQPVQTQQLYRPPQQTGTQYVPQNGHYRENIFIPSSAPTNTIRSSQMNSEEALFKRMRQRESAMMRHPTGQLQGPVQVSMMTREGQEMMQYQQQFARQNMAPLPPSRVSVHAISPIEPINRRMEVVERWRQST